MQSIYAAFEIKAFRAKLNLILELSGTLEIIYCKFTCLIDEVINFMALLTLNLYIQDQELNLIYTREWNTNVTITFFKWISINLIG